MSRGSTAFRFTVYNADNTPELPSNRIVSLYEDRAGALWILTEQQHLIQYLNGRFTHINADRGLRSGALGLSESNGTLVLTTTRGAGIVENARFMPIVDSLEMPIGLGGAVRRLDGTTWIAHQRGIWRVAGGRVEDVTPPALRGLTLWRVALDPAGRLWLSTGSGVWTENRGWHEVRGPDGLSPAGSIVSIGWLWCPVLLDDGLMLPGEISRVSDTGCKMSIHRQTACLIITALLHGTVPVSCRRADPLGPEDPSDIG